MPRKSPQQVNALADAGHVCAEQAASISSQGCQHQPPQAQEQSQDELVLRHLPQVRIIAQQIRRRFRDADLEDLIGYGTLGLLKAIRKFDSSRGVLLRTYAEYRIRGEILDGLRRMRWLSRGACRRKAQYQQSLLADDSPDQLAAERSGKRTNGARKGIPVMDVRSADLEELDQLAREPGWQGGSAPDPATIYDHKERLALLAKALLRLPDRNREVIEMRYQHELQWKQIGELLNEREWAVAEIHASALRRLRRGFPPTRASMKAMPRTVLC